MPAPATRLLLSDGAETVYRHISPSVLVDDGMPMSSVFVPRPIDNGCLSVDRGARTTCSAALELFRGQSPNTSGTLCTTIGNVHRAALAEGVTLAVWADPTPQNPAHALLDVSEAGTGQRKRISRTLRDDCLRHHPPQGWCCQ